MNVLQQGSVNQIGHDQGISIVVPPHTASWRRPRGPVTDTRDGAQTKSPPTICRRVFLIYQRSNLQTKDFSPGHIERYKMLYTPSLMSSTESVKRPARLIAASLKMASSNSAMLFITLGPTFKIMSPALSPHASAVPYGLIFIITTPLSSGRFHRPCFLKT